MSHVSIGDGHRSASTVPVRNAEAAAQCAGVQSRLAGQAGVATPARRALPIAASRGSVVEAATENAIGIHFDGTNVAERRQAAIDRARQAACID